MTQIPLRIRRIGDVVGIFNLIYVLLEVLLMSVDICLRKKRSNLENRNDRNKPNEQENQRKEESDCSYEHCPIKDSRAIHSP